MLSPQTVRLEWECLESVLEGHHASGETGSDLLEVSLFPSLLAPLFGALEALEKGQDKVLMALETEVIPSCAQEIPKP